MCGICGIFEPRSEAVVQRSTLKAMADTWRHRGPDDEGFYGCGPVGLAHRRLSIIDLKGGHQPLSNEDDTVWIAFNGEIYNFEELNRRYLSTGHSFKTRSDTETIIHLYEELGEACFAELRGMFAIALWDGRRKRLLLARDRVGKKPLYYSWDGRRLIFGSEIKALWPAGGLSREIDLEALSDYFSYRYVAAPKTIYRQVRKLKPAHYLIVDAQGLREAPYWELHFDEAVDHSESEWCERLLEEYRTSVSLRLVSDVPLGAFLSGGVDSSSVVALMNEFQSPVTTCSIGFTVQSYNEAAQAKEFATSLRADHHEQMITPQAVDVVSKLAWHYDEPFADSPAVPTYYVSKLARQHVTVALSGDGGDENFAGYGHYQRDLRENQLRSLLPLPVRRAVFGPLGRWYPNGYQAPRIFRAKSTLKSLARSPLEGYFHTVSSCPPDLKCRLLGAEVVRSLNGYDSIEVLRYHNDRAGTTDPVSRLQYIDIKTYLPDDILAKVDRASMANSLEVRCPLLDHRLMELAATMPSHIKLRGGCGKYIFKQALKPVLPGTILNRRKSGFAVPLDKWFQNQLKDYSYGMLFGRRDDYVDYGFVQECWREHDQGLRDWSSLLWTVLMFKVWQEACKAT